MICAIPITKRPSSDEECLSLMQDLIRWKHLPSNVLPRKPKKLTIEQLREKVQRITDILVGIEDVSDTDTTTVVSDLTMVDLEFIDSDMSDEKMEIEDFEKDFEKEDEDDED